MDEFIIDIADIVFDAALAAVVGIGAFVAAQLFIGKYRETIYSWVRSRLKSYPGVQRVVFRALKANYHTEQAIRVKVGNAIYVVTEMLGVKSGNTATKMTNLQASVPDSATTRILTPEELKQFSGGTVDVSQSDSEETLLRKGCMPEKAAIGMGLIDKKGKVKGMHEVCNEQQLMAMRNA